MILGRLGINDEFVKIMVDFEIHLEFGGQVGEVVLKHPSKAEVNTLGWVLLVKMVGS